MRLILAFIAAPTIAAIVLYGLFAGLSVSVPFPGFIVATAIVAMAITLLLGIPTYLFFNAWQLASLRAYVLGGLVLGFVPGAFFAITSGATEFWLVPLASAAGAATFWFTAGSKHNKLLNTDASDAGAG